MSKFYNFSTNLTFQKLRKILQLNGITNIWEENFLSESTQINFTNLTNSICKRSPNWLFKWQFTWSVAVNLGGSSPIWTQITVQVEALWSKNLGLGTLVNRRRSILLRFSSSCNLNYISSRYYLWWLQKNSLEDS